mgnify:FL=1
MKTLLVALLLLVVGTGAVAAERAWVLWLGTTAHAPGDGWSVHSAFPTEAECTGGLASYTDSLKGEGNKTASAPWGVRSAKWQRGEVSVYLRCLPDTIDPRGPKGK